MKKRLEFLSLNQLKLVHNSLVTSRVLLTLIFILIFLLPPISATFNLGTPNYSLEKIYGPSADVAGWLNISFSSESLGSEFTDSNDNSINLSDVLKKNSGYAYSCSPLGCMDDYLASSAGTEKTTTLGAGESKIYGVKLTGSISSIDSFKFTLESDAGPACTSQMEVDFLDNSSMDFKNTRALDSGSCANLRDYGCFNSSLPTEDVTISAPVCEKINLSDSPGFVIGAWLKKTGSTGTLKAEIHKKISQSSAQVVATCTLPDPSTSGEEVNCSINYAPIGFQEHYVCIYLGSATGNYVTKGYGTGTSSNLCGFYGTPINPENAAYQIFAQGKQFDSVGAINMNKSLANGESFASLAANYIQGRYGSLDCTAGCVIPVKIKSNAAGQSITLRDLVVDYTKEIGSVTERSFYDISKTPAKITSGFKKLYLDQAGFTVPDELGNYTFSLDFNGQDVLSEKLQIKDVPIIQSVNPTKTASAFPTEFVVSVDSDYNLTGFSWDFGDGTVKIATQRNKTTHTYNQTGEYTLTLNVTDQRKLSSVKTFLINVSSPADLIVLRLAELKTAIRDINGDIASLDSFSKKAINASLGLPAVEASISSLQSRYSTATTEAQFNGIVTDLIKIKELPESISKTADAGGLLFVSEADYVDLDVLKEIAGGTFGSGDEEGYIQASLFWQLENLETKVDFSEFSGRYNGNLEPVVKTFRISIDEKADIGYDYFLIMPALAGFYSDSAFSNKSGYVYINMQSQRTVSFSTTENVDFTNLPAFISPSISRLSLGETTLPEEKKTNKWLIFGLVILALLVIGVVVYVVLQEWYKRKYENHLFPNRNDLYNMANYIHNAKIKGMGNSDIESNLKKAGWSAERARNAMRKYAGKKTGMLEIPITKAVNKIEGK